MTTWESPRGALITNIELVDVKLLAELYADVPGAWAKADTKTRRAWQLGYRPESQEG